MRNKNTTRTQDAEYFKFQKFGRLTILGNAEKRIGERSPRWTCLCDCGRTTTPRVCSVKGGTTLSCGQCPKDSVSLWPEYSTWEAMIQRCFNEHSDSFPRYGGRGITVCDRWRHSFANFIEDMKRKPTPGHSIERENNDGDYEPGNCVWATRAKQNRNMRSNRWITFKGRTMCLKDWAKDVGVHDVTLSKRLKKWTLERALTEPRHMEDVH